MLFHSLGKHTHMRSLMHARIHTIIILFSGNSVLRKVEVLIWGWRSGINVKGFVEIWFSCFCTTVLHKHVSVCVRVWVRGWMCVCAAVCIYRWVDQGEWSRRSRMHISRSSNRQGSILFEPRVRAGKEGTTLVLLAVPWHRHARGVSHIITILNQWCSFVVRKWSLCCRPIEGMKGERTKVYGRLKTGLVLCTTLVKVLHHQCRVNVGSRRFKG